MTVEKMPVDCDFYEIALEDAALRLGGVPLHELDVYVSINERVRARQLQASHGFNLHLVAPCLMRNRDGWAVSHHGRWIYSDGA